MLHQTIHLFKLLMEQQEMQHGSHSQSSKNSGAVDRGNQSCLTRPIPNGHAQWQRSHDVGLFCSHMNWVYWSKPKYLDLMWVHLSYSRSLVQLGRQRQQPICNRTAEKDQNRGPGTTSQDLNGKKVEQMAAILCESKQCWTDESTDEGSCCSWRPLMRGGKFGL